jgi:formate/nitrite transporter
MSGLFIGGGPVPETIFMDALTPKEIMEKVSDSSVPKATGSFGKLFILSILAGVFIALGAQASLMGSYNLLADPDTFGLGKLVMGAIFPVGLMIVIMCGAELFTGNCMMVIGALDKKICWSSIWRNWTIVYAGNFVGAILIVLCIFISDFSYSSDGLLGAITVKTAVGKCNMGFIKAVVMGILCNVLVCLAIWMATGSPQTIGKIFACWFVVGLFVLSGFEHSIANMYFVPAGILASGQEAFLQLPDLDISGLTWGAFFIRNLFPVTIGNILGGSLFVGATYWLTYRKLI